jgi:TPR repeat protein
MHVAEAGDPNYESQLGVRYATGQGVAKDEVEAAKWFRRAITSREFCQPKEIITLYRCT